MSVTQVTTPGIADSAVTTAKIADNTITTSDINFGTALVPVGGIIMWYGSATTSSVTLGSVTYPGIPTGWALCDGSTVNSLKTPDLRSRFIVGASNNTSTGVTFNANTGAVSGAYAPGNTGGSVAHQLTVAEMPSHAHSRGAIYPGDGTEQNQSGSPEDRTTFNVNTGSTGGDDYHENRPPYYALAFIMRVS